MNVFGEETAINEDEQESNQVTALHDLIAGGIAGSASVVVGHPFDTIKVRLQFSTGSASPASFGGISSLFRGMAAPLSTAAIVNAIIFSSYGASSRLWDDYVDMKLSQQDIIHQHDPWQKAFCCGSFAGAVQSLVICPMEHLKCRLQVQHGKGSADNIYKGPLDAAKSIVRTHGIRGLYRGMVCTAWREIPAFGGYFATYDYLKDITTDYLAEYASEGGTSHTWMGSGLAGGLSGSLTWLLIYPLDVIKTRIQTSSLDKPVSTWNVGRSIVTKQGWRYLFRGLNVTLIRAFPVNGIIFPVYEFTLLHITDGFED